MKKILAMLLCLVMIVGTLSACKSSEKSSGDSTDDSNQTEGKEELVTIDYSSPVEYSYWLYATTGDYNSDYNNNPIVKYLNKKFNMNLTFQQPSSGTEMDSLNLMLGTGEYTDVIDTSYYSGSLDQLFEDGIIIDIAQYLDYMPNFKALLEADDTFRKNTYNDNGQILKLTNLLSENEYSWGGLVYRKDILATMTGNNIAFPSGNESPTTIADWEYMLELYKQYFAAAGMTDSAPFILPAKGYFDSGDLLTGFGTAPSYYDDNGTVKYGPMQDGFYNYLTKMREWYEKGYIYKDFASRTNDLFYLPNTALTYGGAAGMWFGLSSQLGDTMSMPDYGLFYDVLAVASPLDSDNAVTTAPNLMYTEKNEMAGGVMITTSCQNIERLLATFDYLYSTEGSYLKGYGLSAEQGSKEDELYVANGLAEGVYSVEADGSLKFNEKTLLGGGTMALTDFIDVRTPGLRDIKYTKESIRDEEKIGSDIWLTYQASATSVKKLPAISRTVEEDSTYTMNQSNIDDYVNTMVLKFILSSEELNETTWAKFKEQLEAYGVSENIAIMQAAYDRYQDR